MRTLGFASEENINVDIFIEYGYLSNITEVKDNNNAQMIDSLLIRCLKFGVVSPTKDSFILIIKYDTDEKEENFCGFIILEKSNNSFIIKNIILEKRLFNEDCLSVVFQLIQNFSCRIIGQNSIMVSYNGYHFNCQFDCDVNNVATQMTNIAIQEGMADLQENA